MPADAQPTDIGLLTTAIANLNHAVTYKLVQAPCTGNDKKLIRTWLDNISKQAELLNLDDAGKISILYQNSEGGLSSFIKRWIDTATGARTFAELKKTILINFSDTPDPATALDQLRKIRQNRDEPVSLFAERIFVLARDCFPDQDLNDEQNQRFAQQQLIFYFTQGLQNSKIKFKVMSSHPESLTKAVQIARDHINLLNSFNATMLPDDNVQGRTEEDMDTSMSTLHVKRSRRPILTIDRRGQQTQRRNPMACWNCGSYTHLASECRNRNTQRQGFSRPNNYNQGQRNRPFTNYNNTANRMPANYRQTQSTQQQNTYRKQQNKTFQPQNRQNNFTSRQNTTHRQPRNQNYSKN